MQLWDIRMIRTSSTATDGGIGIKMISQISVQNPKDPIKPYSSSSLLELSSVRSMTTYLLGKAPLLFFLNPPSHCFHIHHQGGWPYYGDRIHQRCFIEQKATSFAMWWHSPTCWTAPWFVLKDGGPYDGSHSGLKQRWQTPLCFQMDLFGTMEYPTTLRLVLPKVQWQMTHRWRRWLKLLWQLTEAETIPLCFQMVQWQMTHRWEKWPKLVVNWSGDDTLVLSNRLMAPSLVSGA